VILSWKKRRGRVRWASGRRDKEEVRKGNNKKLHLIHFLTPTTE